MIIKRFIPKHFSTVPCLFALLFILEMLGDKFEYLREALAILVSGYLICKDLTRSSEDSSITATEWIDSQQNINIEAIHLENMNDNNNNNNNRNPEAAQIEAEKRLIYKRLYEPIKIIEKFITEKCGDASKLSALANPLLFRMSEEDLAKEIISELFAIDRFTRLQPLLKYIKSSIYSKNDRRRFAGEALTDSLAVLLLISLRIPNEKEQLSTESTFNILKIQVVRLLVTSTDFFLYEFFLRCVGGGALVEEVLRKQDDPTRKFELQDSIIDYSSIRAEFMKNRFMSTLPPYKKATSNFIFSLFGKNSGNDLYEETQMVYFDNFAKKIVLRINNLQAKIWPYNKSPDELSSGFIVLEPNSSVSNQYQYRAPEIVNATKDDINNFKPLEYGKEDTVFADIIEERKLILDEAIKEFNDLIYDRKIINVLDAMYDSAISGYSSPQIHNRVKQLQMGYKYMITALEEYHTHDVYYNKGFTVQRLIKFIRNYLTELMANPRVLTLQAILEYITKGTTLLTHLENVYIKYTTFDAAYRYSQHTHKINKLKNILHTQENDILRRQQNEDERLANEELQRQAILNEQYARELDDQIRQIDAVYARNRNTTDYDYES